MKSYLTPIALAMMVAGLSACGGGSSNSTTPTPEPISYKVNFKTPADMAGKVCADANQNLKCDNGEVSADINAGAAAIASPSVGILNSQYVLVSDDKMQLAAPAAVADDKTVTISPATTLVVANMLQGDSKDQAVDKVVASLNNGLAVTLSKDTLLTESHNELVDFNKRYFEFWQAAYPKMADTSGLLAGVSIQLDQVVSAAKDNKLMTELDNIVANANIWHRGFPMTDTGITLYTDDANYDLAEAHVEFPGQDAAYGLDQSQNDNKDGAAGFRYQKLDADGNDLAADASAWQCVKDLETGLIWEVKADPALDTDSNVAAQSGAALFVNIDQDRDFAQGEIDEASCSDAQGACSVQAYVKYLNSANDGKGLCGSTNWQTPDFDQLYSLVHMGSTHKNSDDELLSVDVNYFPHMQANDYWTSSRSVEAYNYDTETKYLWTIGFNDSYIGATTSYDYCVTNDDCDYPNALPVRLVTVGEK